MGRNRSSWSLVEAWALPRSTVLLLVRSAAVCKGSASSTLRGNVTSFKLRSSWPAWEVIRTCLLYTSDAADDLLCVDLGGRRIIKKKKTIHATKYQHSN